MVDLLGQRDELLRLIESSFPVEIHVRGNEITVAGAPAHKHLNFAKATHARSPTMRTGRFTRTVPFTVRWVRSMKPSRASLRGPYQRPWYT